MAKTGDKAEGDRIDAYVEDDRDGRSGRLAANVEVTESEKITVTLRATRSAASDDNRAYSPRAQRYSIATFWPSTKPASLSP